MSELTRRLRKRLYQAEERLDTARFAVRRRLGWLRPLHIVSYLGYGNDRDVYLAGRVLEDKGIRPADATDNSWENIRRAYKRFQSDEVPHVRVRARFAGDEQQVRTDGEGYFRVHLHPQQRLPSGRLWHDVEVELVDQVVPNQGRVHGVGRVQIPPAGAQFGIISDVDDTVLQTGATSLGSMLRVTLLQNAHTRLPFEGVSSFYRALQQGPDRAAWNPIFYVSSSPWNLYDFLVDFFAVQALPAGTLFLRDLGLEAERFLKSSHHAHKLDQIDRAFAAYPHLPFVLIGDSGQQDPEIYLETVRSHPGRVVAIYIRDVSAGRRRAEVQHIAAQVEALGANLLLVPDTATAAVHAAMTGLIDPEAAEEVRAGTTPTRQTMGDVIDERR